MLPFLVQLRAQVVEVSRPWEYNRQYFVSCVSMSTSHSDPIGVDIQESFMSIAECLSHLDRELVFSDVGIGREAKDIAPVIKDEQAFQLKSLPDFVQILLRILRNVIENAVLQRFVIASPFRSHL